MPEAQKNTRGGRPAGPNVFAVLQPYRGLIAALVILTWVGNILNLFIPKIISVTIDAYSQGSFVFNSTVLQFGLVAIGIFVFAYLASIVQTITAERVARDLRTKLIAKISVQDYATVQQMTPAKLLTNLTSDIDGIKMFVSMGVPSMFSSVFLIFGASGLLLSINWKLACAVLLTLPMIGGTFFVIFKKVSVLFKQAQEALDRLNKVINESILGASLIRLLNSQGIEYQKFLDANANAKSISLRILNLFATLIPAIMFATNLATLIILVLGGYFVINGTMTLGSFTAFNSYLAILVMPIIILGFTSNLMAQAGASYGRILEVLSKKDEKKAGELQAPRHGEVAIQDVSVTYGEKTVLKNVSFTVPAGKKTAIIGPTAAGKTQLLYLLTGLLAPAKGTITYAGKALTEYDPVSLHRQIGFVFQDSILFNLSVRENIAFDAKVQDADLKKAIETAELQDFITTLPQGLETIVSERGSNLSGGQKQRLMLARALALNPSVLLLDDFTARVDTATEQKILKNVQQNYPEMTIISVTQKVASVEHYDQIILLMEGELLAKGTHKELMETSPEYMQIANSQRTTSAYELHAE